MPLPVYTALSHDARDGVHKIPLGASYDLSLSRYNEGFD